MISDVTSNHRDSQDNWQPDDKTNETLEAGEVAKDVQSFVQNSLPTLRPWVSGLTLATASMSRWQFCEVRDGDGRELRS